MKKWSVFLVLLMFLTGCAGEAPEQPSAQPERAPVIQETSPPETQTLPPEENGFCLRGVTAEEVIAAFQEVCLAAEFPGDGIDYTIIHKWQDPLIYRLEGEYTPEDLQSLHSFAAWLNELEGFPGIYPEAQAPVEDPVVNLIFRFWEQEQLDAYTLSQYGTSGCEGFVTVWYGGGDLYVSSAEIMLSTQISQEVRSTVLLEEIYNALGPLQDTTTREDSVIYQFHQEVPPQWLTPMDELILKLLYHPDITLGMTIEECEAVIRSLYTQAD